MNVQFQPNFKTAERHLPFKCVAPVLKKAEARSGPPRSARDLMTY
jgi:hypothetical protein